jgi:hypothetical protein
MAKRRTSPVSTAETISTPMPIANACGVTSHPAQVDAASYSPRRSAKAVKLLLDVSTRLSTALAMTRPRPLTPNR